MKVLHLISGGDTGGAKTHVFALLGKLKEMADVKIVCFMKGVFWDELQGTDIESELVLQKNRFDMSVLNRLEDICAEGYDIIHCHGARANFIASRLAKRVNVPIVTTIHSDYLLDFDGFYKKLVYTSLNILALKQFRYYIAVSSDFKNMLVQRNFRPNSIFTVYNGMDYSISPTYVSKEEFANRIGIKYDETKTYIGIIGRHDYVKGHDVFIKAIKTVCKECPDARFIIAGDGENRKALAELAKKEGVDENLIFAGFIKDIYSFINFIDINTLTSRSESFPYVLMEGAKMYKPTVCSAVGGIPDFVIDGKTGLLFENENSKEFANKLITLIKDKALAKRYGNALHDLAVEKFSDTALANKHIEIYNAILRDSGESKKYDAVLSGYYGFGNSGDDALLFAIAESLRKKMPDIRLLALTARASRTRKQYGIDCAPRFNPFTVKKVLKSTKMLISGGGSLIQDVTSSKSLLYYTSVINLAKKCGTKVFVYANGIGPLKDKNLPVAKKALECADIITLREAQSLTELDRMNLENKNVLLTADPALLLDGESEEITKNVLESENIPAEKKFFGISVREWRDNERDFATKLAGISDYAYEKYRLCPLFIPMRYPHDLKISEEIACLTKAPSYVLKNAHSVRETIGLVAKTELVFGMRLHTLIYAAGKAVPVVGLIYDQKVSGFLDYIGQNRSVDVNNIDVSKACAYIDEIMTNKQTISDELNNKKNELCVLADKNAEIAINILCGGAV